MERYNEESKLVDDGKFDADGVALKFDAKGEVLAGDVSLDDLHKAKESSVEGDEPKLDELDDDQLFMNDDDDDLFEEVPDIPENESEEDKLAREKADEEAEDLRLVEEEKGKLEKEPEELPDTDELAKAKLRIKELELGTSGNVERREIPSDDTAITTVGDLKKLQNDIAFNEQLDKQAYQKDYILSFYKEAYAENMTTTEADTLFDFLVLPENDSYNQMRTSDGNSDGMINFNKIIRVFKAKDIKKVPLKHDKVKTTNLKHGNGGITKTKKKVIVKKLDEVSQRFIKSTGMSEEDQYKALKGTSSIHSKGGRLI